MLISARMKPTNRANLSRAKTLSHAAAAAIPGPIAIAKAQTSHPPAARTSATQSGPYYSPSKKTDDSKTVMMLHGGTWIETAGSIRNTNYGEKAYQLGKSL
jgi:hypothetical protein